MIDVLKLHESETDDIETGEVLNLAESVYVQRKINEMSVLEFDYPMDDKARLIAEGKICSSGGQRYEVLRTKRSMSKTDMLHVTCRDLFSRRAKDKFIPTVADKIGVKIKNFLNYVITAYASDFSLYSDAELAEMGMEWVSDDYRIDFFTVDKTNLWDLLHTVVDNLGRGEIYSDGYKFAIVEKIGQDRGVRLTLHKNMENIDVEKTTEEIITRLWPFGADDMPITSVNSGKAYIDSPNIALYGVHEGYRDYSDYTDASKILANAQWEFDADNEDRIDIPQITITGKVIDLSKLKEYGELEKIELGDTVHVIDNDGTEYTERVIEGVWYPYEAKQTTLSIGHMRRDVFFTLYQLQHSKMELEAVQTTGKQLRTRSLAGVVNSTRNNVQSDNELLKIVGDLLTIEDKKRIRIRLGNYKGEFVFIIYDAEGGEAIYLNEEGKAVFAGSIDTAEDVSVGNKLILRAPKTAMTAADNTIEFRDKNGDVVFSMVVTEDGTLRFVSEKGKSIYKGAYELATEQDIKYLQDQIDELKGSE